MKKNEKPPRVLTPELEKLAEVRPDNQVISSFLEWLEEKEIVLAEWSGSDCEECGAEHLIDMIQTKEQLLANYFSINLDKCEEERQAMLDQIRAEAE